MELKPSKVSVHLQDSSYFNSMDDSTWFILDQTRTFAYLRYYLGTILLWTKFARMGQNGTLDHRSGKILILEIKKHGIFLGQFVNHNSNLVPAPFMKYIHVRNIY